MNHILVIEDDENIRKILVKFLSNFNCEVESAHDGDAGIELFDNSVGFDLVITDIQMPGADGNEVARHIRSSEKTQPPIVAITGYIDEAQESLFDFMLRKPFNLKALAGVVESFV